LETSFGKKGIRSIEKGVSQGSILK